MTQVHLTSEELFLTHNREVEGDLGRRVLAHLSACVECEKKLADFSKIEALFQKRNFEEPSIQTINRILQKASSPSLVSGSVEAVKAWWKSWVLGLGLTGALAGMVFVMYPKFQPTPSDQNSSSVAVVGSEAKTQSVSVEKKPSTSVEEKSVPTASDPSPTSLSLQNSSDKDDKKEELVAQPVKKKIQNKPKSSPTSPSVATSSPQQSTLAPVAKSKPIKIKGVSSLVSMDAENDVVITDEKPVKKDWSQNYLNKARNYAANGNFKSADINYRSAYRSAKTPSLKKTILSEWTSFLEKNGKNKQAQKKGAIEKKKKSSTNKF